MGPELIYQASYGVMIRGLENRGKWLIGAGDFDEALRRAREYLKRTHPDAQWSVITGLECLGEVVSR